MPDDPNFYGYGVATFGSSLFFNDGQFPFKTQFLGMVIFNGKNANINALNVYGVHQTDAPSRAPTLASSGTSTTSSSDLIALQNMGWHVNFTLTECQGDCDDDSDCLGELQC